MKPFIALGIVAWVAFTHAAQSGAPPDGRAEGELGPATERKGSLSEADQMFIQEAYEGGLAEVKLGRLAEARAHNDDVKAFGRRMVKDHSEMNARLKGLADANKVAVPSELSTTNRAAYDRLSKLSGHDFDSAYVKQMVLDHKKDVATFERESKTADCPEVRELAKTALETLRDHLQSVQHIDANLTSKPAPADQE